jgi:SsrA-binding protein
MPTYARNKKATFDFEVLERIEAGLKLTGNEVKAIKTTGTKLTGAFVGFKNTEAYLASWHIPAYRFSTVGAGFNPERNRTLLLKKKQIDYLRGKAQEKGLTIIPLSVYSKGNLVKVELGIAKGKKQYDKRNSIKKRDLDRQEQRYLKKSY